ncbi:hypothetical protein UA08_09465 [Talaromyces atroroseus]|uniref:chitinase n=1 Tax=Talaromyces atroroseus TaxID=1441469 RepID=A0A1Q5Q647_TALAT|nr:hypothetical protein UA08_09465 [Talaromyces atroroseus]OKL55264.1 hypothetical protein UA08_09465 [Talaromyces atroroseus]
MRSSVWLAVLAGQASLTSAKSRFEVNHGSSLNHSYQHGLLHSRDLPTGTCNAATPCANGACCGSDNLCGYSAAFCGTGCQSNCDAKAECGPYAVEGQQTCPLNVCCSEFGFCGSTTEFCVWSNPDDPEYSTCSTEYGGCGSVKRPACSTGGNSVGKRNIGYYESWANTRTCDQVAPEDLNLDGFTSINFAFAFFDPTSFQISPMDGNAASLYSRFTALKGNKPGLETWISVGGWSFTDPGSTQRAFSDMASSAANRQAFINGVIQFMNTYGFDGLDLDWEYPGADDRGGVPADTENFVTLCHEIRAAFGTKYGLTVTLPTSYWYLQHFDLPGIQDSVDWFNLMAYDLHGVWDAQSIYVGPYIAPHTNITEIDLALDLLWRAGVDSSKVVMGQGWYGRSFTLEDPNCNTPNGVCQFSGGGDAGPCSQASGILNYEEISDVITEYGVQPVWDKTAAVKWISWADNQWVSYDDGDTFKQKRDFANSRCLGGLMVWAVDQVSQTADNGFGGSAAAAGTSVTPSQQADADQSSKDSLAGLTCYVADCGQTCKPGTGEVAQFNGQPGQLSTSNRCASKSYRSLCCDSKTNVGTCQWRGYRGAGLSCIGGCADGETELTTNTNSHDSKAGDKNCHGGLQSFCCANFQPTSSSLQDDLEDAAKAAAEAAAEQAALDIAAKAFCRIAVPALLAPLELVEDLIPIFGEIADAIEIAATPAIIDGCVKGIEKEGKAEFKVFGKKHTLSFSEPTTKPTDVPDRPPSKSDTPTKTGDKDEPTCQAKAKRADAPVPTNTHYVDSNKFKILSSTVHSKKNTDWVDGQGWAIKAQWPPTGVIALPEHYQLIAGYVTVARRQTEDVDSCGNTKRVVVTLNRDWQGYAYDIRAQGGRVIFMIRTASAATWDGDNAKRTYGPFTVVYSDLGPIRQGLDFAQIQARGQVLANTMGPYVYWTNNCNTFATRLYQDIAL